MILEVRSAAAAALGALRFGLLALAALVLAHDIVYLQAHGAEAGHALEALGHAGHRPALVMAAAGASVALTAWSVARLISLASRLNRGNRWGRGAAIARRTARTRPGYVGTCVRLWALLSLVVVPAFFVQENLEHQGTTGIFPGIGVFTGAHAGALPTLLAVILVVAAIGSLVRWQIARLTQRLTVAHELAWRAEVEPPMPAQAFQLVALLVRLRWLLARRTPERAPPVLAA